MLPMISRTLLLFLLFDNLVYSARKYKDCNPSPLGPDYTVRVYGTFCYGISNSIYFISPGHMECQSKKAKLAEPQSNTVAQWLISFVRDLDRETWIGVRRYYKDPNIWISLENYVPLNFTLNNLWAPGQPNNDGSCILLEKKNNFLWNDKPCWDQHQIICQIERGFTECLPNPCMNGGVCEDVVGPDIYRCICVPGTTGTNCSQDIDECASNPCIDDVECHQGLTLNMYQCLCKNRRAGKSCQYDLPDKPTHDCEPYLFEGDTLSCTCSTKFAGTPPAKVGFLLGEGSYSPTLLKTGITADDDGMEFTCGFYWQAEGEMAITGENKYKLALAYGPSDKDTSIAGPRKILTDGESGLTVTLTCSSYRSYPDPNVIWEEVLCLEGNFYPECRFYVADNVKQMDIFCTLKNPIRDTVIGKANHTLRIDHSKTSVIVIRDMRIGEDYITEADAGQNMELVCEAFGGDPRPVYLEVYHTPGIKELNEVTGGTKLIPLGVSTPTRRTLRKTYSVKASDICNSMDGYRCDTKAELEGDVIVKFAGLKTNCSSKAPEDKAPIAPIAVGTGSSLLGLLAAFLLWKRRNRAEGVRKMEADRELNFTQEDDEDFSYTPSEAIPTENPTKSAEGGDDNETSEAQAEEVV